MKRTHFRIAVYPVFWIMLGALLLTSCRNDAVGPETIKEAHAENALEVQKFILEYNFGIPTDNLTESQITQEYTRLMKQLPEAYKETLLSVVQQGLAEQEKETQASPPAAKNGFHATLTAGISDDAFGQGVATVGNKVYVGARNTQKVYEYAKTGGAYALVNVITPSENAKDFGYHVSVSGSWMAVSAPEFGPPYPSGAGKVFMFKKQGNTWVQKAILYGPVGDGNFGGDGMVLHGSQLAVTSRGSSISSGNISVFEASGNTWTLSATLNQPGYSFFAIDMDQGGNHIVATGPFFGSGLGARALIFEKIGSAWSLDEEVIITDPLNPFGIIFARDVAIHSNAVIISSILPGNKHWVITQDGGSWAVAHELETPPAIFSNRFVEIQGAKLIVGVESSSNFSSDKVYVFEKSGNSWALTETLVPSDGGVDGRIWSVALQGNTIVAGLTGLRGAAGRAYVFE